MTGGAILLIESFSCGDVRESCFKWIFFIFVGSIYSVHHGKMMTRVGYIHHAAHVMLLAFPVLADRITTTRLHFLAAIFFTVLLLARS